MALARSNKKEKQSCFYSSLFYPPRNVGSTLIALEGGIVHNTPIKNIFIGIFFGRKKKKI